jgi:hypothetical protein
MAMSTLVSFKMGSSVEKELIFGKTRNSSIKASSVMD